MASPRIRFPYVKRYKLFIFWSTIILAFTVFFDTNIMAQSSLKQYLRTLRWTPLPVGVGLALIAFQQYRHTRKREAAKLGQLEPCNCLADEWEVEAYKLLPLRSFSRAWGWVNGLELPEWSRKSVLGLYVRTFGCNMAEAEVEDLGKYKCLSELFRRSLKDGLRPVDASACVVSPVDGRILSFGAVSCGTLDQVKGVSYPLRKFLGPNCWSEGGPMVVNKDDDDCFHRTCLRDCDTNMLYQCVIYLAPGDYHRFHSCADWKVIFRRHFPGELLSVNPNIAAWVRNLFILNERVSYVGQWKHGFFSMTAVGATNVGSIKVYFDEELRTNEKKLNKSFHDKHFKDKPIELSRGGEFGEFNLGSTIVLVFEAPKDTIIMVDIGQKVRMGQALFRIPNSYVGKARTEIAHPGPQR
ncbi:phosphatidylserine decarboxylase proenzyme, mitochondrial isoform X2 [Procambarus clarkii]|uniref:phosphatidylserine decarboxylase proenzyme, mitochondrial isoform X2 n=1 Tax=Procambarus clarkii TaxID=6728 RepID=UPI001E671B14|nr:phosphatidylserine decarboxylase proenzyme, mitochondrial-like isoform X2 [Procambarus clarkii]